MLYSDKTRAPPPLLLELSCVLAIWYTMTRYDLHVTEYSWHYCLIVALTSSLVLVWVKHHFDFEREVFEVHDVESQLQYRVEVEVQVPASIEDPDTVEYGNER